MNPAKLWSRLLQQEHLNFVLTNCLPRRTVTRLVGRLSKIDNPLFARFSIAVWKLFSDLDLSEASTTDYRSLHECFVRQLKPGARPVDPDPAFLTSPSDGVVGAHGRIERGVLVQAKDSRYTLSELLGSSTLAEQYADGSFITLRLRSSMYHRFHAPHDCNIERVTYFHGDVWNVNPPTLKRVSRLFCRNERAVLLARLQPCNSIIALVPVGAILVASIRLHFLDTTLHMNYRGPSTQDCNARLAKGEEMGWFEHGSTIIVIAPRDFAIVDNLREGDIVQMGRPLMRLAGANPT